MSSLTREQKRRAQGRRLRESRNAAGFTQQAVAEALELTPQAIRNWERGLCNPAAETKKRLAKLYGSTVDQLERPPTDWQDEGDSDNPNQLVRVHPERLHKARTNAGLTLRQVADQAGVTQETVGRHERGVTTPTLCSLRKLAAVYRRPMRWFVVEKTDPGAAAPVSDEPGASNANLVWDSALKAYETAQPDLSDRAVDSIAAYIRFTHEQELTERSRR